MQFGKGQSFKLLIGLVFGGVVMIIVDIVLQAHGKTVSFGAAYTFYGATIGGAIWNYIQRSRDEAKNGKTD